MLVLRRKTKETLVIDGEIKITILGIKGSRVKVGVMAPPDVTIVRGELGTALDNGASTPVASPSTPPPELLAHPSPSPHSKRASRQ